MLSIILEKIYINTKKLQTRITVTLNHTPDRPKDRPPHVSTCAHTFALLRCEHVLIWGGRSGVWLSVTVILVCSFLVFVYIFFLKFFFEERGGAAPPLSLSRSLLTFLYEGH